MNVFKLFLLCLGLHFFSDFTLQGILAQTKCSEWWEKNYPQEFYRRDWICGLWEHSIYWTLVTFAPVIYLWNMPMWGLGLLVLVNIIEHAWIDNKKANKREISLCQDQLCHLVQIVFTVLVFAVCRS